MYFEMTIFMMRSFRCSLRVQGATVKPSGNRLAGNAQPLVSSSAVVDGWIYTTGIRGMDRQHCCRAGWLAVLSSSGYQTSHQNEEFF